MINILGFQKEEVLLALFLLIAVMIIVLWIYSMFFKNIKFRSEVWLGESVKKFNEVRDILEANKIKYKYNCVDRSSLHKRFEGHSNYSKMYYIYVNKKDEDSALHLIGALK